jgi:hypothetical protein
MAPSARRRSQDFFSASGILFAVYQDEERRWSIGVGRCNRLSDVVVDCD